VLIFQQEGFAPFQPIRARDLAVSCLECAIQSFLIQIPFKLGNVALVAIIPAGFVEHLDEYRQQAVEFTLGDRVGFLVNIEQDALRGDAGGFLQITF